jgi:hypothetical protein
MRQLHATLSLAVRFLVSTALLGCGLAAATHHDEDGVRNVVNRFAETWNKHDMDALGELFASNADFVQVNGVWWKGRQEIQKNVAFLHGTVPQTSVGVTLPSNTYGVFSASTYRFDELNVRFITKDVAVAHVVWTQLGDPRFTEPRRGMLSFVVTWENDRWVLNAAQNTLR